MFAGATSINFGCAMSRLTAAAGAGVALYLLWRRWRRDDLAATFARDGYCIIRNALSPEECDAIEANYNKLTHPTPEMEAKMGCDFGDQSQGFGVKQADFVLINVLQPGKHLKGFDDNPFVRRCREWTRTLIGDGCAIDYAQLLEKVANRPNAVSLASGHAILAKAVASVNAHVHLLLGPDRCRRGEWLPARHPRDGPDKGALQRALGCGGRPGDLRREAGDRAAAHRQGEGGHHPVAREARRCDCT